MKYNKSEIMSQAWEWFNNGDVALADIEWTSYNDTVKTFAVCLKASWAKAKEEVKEEQRSVAKSEELKAFKWAEKKLGVEILVSDAKKVNDVVNEMKHSAYTISVFQAAMRTVKMSIKLGYENIKKVA